MANFEKAFKKTIQAEGGYVNNPNDKGGETYMGVTRKNHPKLKMWEIIDFYKKNVPNRKPKELNSILCGIKDVQEDVKSVYFNNYWKPLSLDKVFSQKLANQFFDNAINCGVQPTIKLMQRLANLPETGRMNAKLIGYYYRKERE